MSLKTGVAVDSDSGRERQKEETHKVCSFLAPTTAELENKDDEPAPGGVAKLWVGSPFFAFRARRSAAPAVRQHAGGRLPKSRGRAGSCPPPPEHNPKARVH